MLGMGLGIWVSKLGHQFLTVITDNLVDFLIIFNLLYN